MKLPCNQNLNFPRRNLISDTAEMRDQQGITNLIKTSFSLSRSRTSKVRDGKSGVEKRIVSKGRQTENTGKVGRPKKGGKACGNQTYS